MNIFQDISTAAKVFTKIRKARKGGASDVCVNVKPVRNLSCVSLGPAYLNTMEGCLTWRLGREADLAVKEVFKRLPYETKSRLEFTPKEPGEWAERARFWQRELEPVLPPKMYHQVMILFIRWYAYRLRVRIAGREDAISRPW